MNAPPSPVVAGRDARRGVLLLVVLSMLTLFLMLGAAYVVAATRAREAARAYARLTFGGDEARVPHAQLLDRMLLSVVRGPVVIVGSGTFESLLADRYGPTMPGGLMGSASVISGPIITVTATIPTLTNPTDLNGRVLTFAEAGRPVTSHRIIRAVNDSGVGTTSNAAATRFVLRLDTPATGRPRALPRGTQIRINGREFAGEPSANPLTAPANESWDGFDDHNLFLARVDPGSSISSSIVSRLSFEPSPPSLTATLDVDSDGFYDAADNDGDGVYDGVFRDFGIPDFTDAFGNAVRVRASVLIVDLDGRFNVNAHGSLAPVLYGTGHPGWTADTVAVTTGSLAHVPLGSGYGPADIAANLGPGNAPKSPDATASGTRMFDGVELVATGTESPRLAVLTGARAFDSGAGMLRFRGRRVAGSRYSTSEDTPRLRPAEGRYGEQSPRSWLTVSATLSDSSASFAYARPGRRNFADHTSMVVATRWPNPAQSGTNFGVPAMWWNGSNTFNAGAAGAAYPLPRGVFNSPPDLHGRMKTLTVSATASGSAALAPRLIFAQPEWSSPTDPREIKDNPYEVRLDTRRGFGGSLKDPATDGQGISTSGSFVDNPFTPAELEPVLRPYDIDTNRCPPRLAALLGSAGEDSRLKITTDSWDTTAITGGTAGAAGRLFAWLRNATTGSIYLGNAVTGDIGGEVARGERFDLNRPLAAFETANAGYTNTFHYYVQRQAYFKDLYTLLVALEQGGGAAPSAARAAELAQWAANVVEFRDADSRVTPFEYDTNPQNGWSVGGNVGLTSDDVLSQRAVVWGVERPEILIRETFAWDYGSGAGEGGLAVVLHRPWNAVALAASGTIAGEPCDYAFDTRVNASDAPGNVVDLGKKSGTSALTPNATAYNDVSPGTFPIWRLRIVAGGTSYVRFDMPAPGGGATGTFAPQTLANGNDKPKLPVDGTLTIHSGSTAGSMTVRFGPVVSPTTATLTIGGSTAASASGTACPMGTNFRIPSGSGTATLYLERLSDPSRQPTAAQWAADPLAFSPSSTETLRYVVVDSCVVNNTNTASGDVPVNSRRRSAAAQSTAFWRNQPSDFVNGATLSAGGSANLPTAIPDAQRDNVAWFPWPNRPFVSAAELCFVPRSNSQNLLANYERITTGSSGFTIPLSGDLTLDRLFDAVHVPTRFAGIHVSSTATLNVVGIFNTTTFVNQLSSFREPGRVNLNTVTSPDVWNAVVGGPLSTVAAPFPSSLLSTPARSLAGLLGLGGGTVPIADTGAPLSTLNRDRNPLHRFYTATRLANTVTPRSNVFAIWITLRESVANDPDSVRFRRAFYIVDRSIPVGFEEGRDLNVWDCVRVRRIIE
jgi:hypothetical protein